MTRLFDAHIIASEETFRQVGDLVRYRELGTPRLKGIKHRQALYEILGYRDAEPAPFDPPLPSRGEEPTWNDRRS
jgi:class 3 adenylate cyclase